MIPKPGKDFVLDPTKPKFVPYDMQRDTQYWWGLNERPVLKIDDSSKKLYTFKQKLGDSTMPSTINFFIEDGKAVVALTGVTVRNHLHGSKSAAGGLETARKLYTAAVRAVFKDCFDEDLKLLVNPAQLDTATETLKPARDNKALYYLHSNAIFDPAHNPALIQLPNEGVNAITASGISFEQTVNLHVTDHEVKIVMRGHRYWYRNSEESKGNPVYSKWEDNLRDSVARVLHDFVNKDLTIKPGQRSALMQFIKEEQQEFKRQKALKTKISSDNYMIHMQFVLFAKGSNEVFRRYYLPENIAVYKFQQQPDKYELPCTIIDGKVIILHRNLADIRATKPPRPPSHKLEGEPGYYNDLKTAMQQVLAGKVKPISYIEGVVRGCLVEGFEILPGKEAAVRAMLRIERPVGGQPTVGLSVAEPEPAIEALKKMQPKSKAKQVTVKRVRISAPDETTARTNKNTSSEADSSIFDDFIRSGGIPVIQPGIPSHDDDLGLDLLDDLPPLPGKKRPHHP